MNPWLTFLKEYKEKHPEMSYKDCMEKAAVEYKKLKK